MLLLITGSRDGTSDRLVLRYGDGVFRFNYDLWRDYVVSYTPDSWFIRNPAGLEISSNTITRAFWWKAFAFPPGDDRLIREEIKYFLRDLFGWCRLRGIAKGNGFDYHNKFAKINILDRAKTFFPIPKSQFSVGLPNRHDFFSTSVVAKSLSSEVADNKSVMLTTEIASINNLDENYPWFLQEKINSKWDVTVFFCDGRLFPFRRSRDNLKGIDWRAEQDFTLQKEEWLPFELDSDQQSKMLRLAKDLDVEIGRFDFMSADNDTSLYFLELNATGQWVFLDVRDKYGLLDTVVHWLKQ